MYKVRAVISERVFDNIDLARKMAFKRIELVNKENDSAKVKHANTYLLSGFKVSLEEYEEWLDERFN